jgi:oligopeptide/dipeptide ABC transporter ATP-binding protein
VRNSEPAVLSIQGLETHFHTRAGVVRAVRGVDLEVGKGETLGVVGESGSGKTVTFLSVLGLLPRIYSRVPAGTAFFDDSDLLRMNDRQLQSIRGKRISMIFQEPMTSLNPVYTIGYQIAEILLAHRQVADKKGAYRKAEELLFEVGIPEPERRVHEYPHQLSGGMRQRAMIAMALSCNPELLIADEPTTALDVTIQAQILLLLKKLQQEYGMSVVIITHDLGVVAQVADRIAVMYSGHVFETAPTRKLFRNSRNPYTRGLLNSIPRIHGGLEELVPIPGVVPVASRVPPGCAFHPRCRFADELCRQQLPEVVSVGENHQTRCHHHEALPAPEGVR